MKLKFRHKISIVLIGLGVLAALVFFGAGTPNMAEVFGIRPAPEPGSIAAELAEDIPYEEVVRKIVPHKALYRLSLVEIHAGAPINELNGDMFFKWEDTCDAWSTDHRFRIDYFYTDRPSVAVTSHFVAWEDKSGDRIHFLSEGYTDGVLDDKNRGESHRLDDLSGVVDYREPAGLNYKLKPNFFFPAQHTIATIHAALTGETFFNAVMFDGTDDEGPSEINVFINQASVNAPIPARLTSNKNIDQSLLSGKAWDMRLAFFPLRGEESDQATPAYEMKVRLHENGVVSDIVVEYEKFSVRQELIALAKLPAAGCGGAAALGGMRDG